MVATAMRPNRVVGDVRDVRVDVIAWFLLDVARRLRAAIYVYVERS